jgi:tape measure domain-containing protein
VGTIRTGIELNDNFSSVLYNIIGSVNLAIYQMEEMRQSLSASIDTSHIEGARESIDRATMSLREMEEAASVSVAPAMSSMNVAAANSSYEQLRQNVESTGQHIRDNTNEQQRFNQSVDGGTASSNNLIKSIMKLSIVRSVVNTVTGQIDAAMKRMDTMTNFQRTMTAITGSSDMAATSLSQLKDITKGTAYGLDVAARATQNFTTRGMSIGHATSEVGKWADAVAFYGNGTNEALTTVTDALGKMMTKGTVEMEQLNRLTDNGINAVGMYAQATGRSAADVQSDLSDGVISSMDFISTVSTAFEEGTNGVLNISGAAKEAGATWATTIANAKAAITRGWISLIDNANAALANAGFGTILDGIREFGETAESVMGKIGVAVGIMLTILSPAFQFMQDAAGFIADNWSILEPIVWGLIAALVVYNATMGIAWLTTLQNIAAKIAHALASAAETVAIFALIAAQDGLNAALAACPLTWIIILIIAIIALIFAVCTAIAKMTGVANTGFGVICGGINVVIELFKNLGLGIADFAIGAGLAINALAQNIMTAFGNAIRAVQSWWYGLLSTVMTVISGICAQLNKLPFVEFDYSGVTEAANKYAGKAAELAGQKGDYESISDAFKEGWNTFDIFPKNWVNNAFNKGSEWGDDKMNKLSGLLDGFGNIPNADDYLKGYGDDSTNNLGDTLDKSGTGNKVADIANSAGNIENTLTATSEDLKYLRDIAERDTINRFTTAEISIVQTNNNKIASDMDLDGVVEGLTSAVDEAISNATEGVH